MANQKQKNVRLFAVVGTILDRRKIVEIASSISGAQVAGSAATTNIALAKIRHEPVDLLLLGTEVLASDGMGAVAKVRQAAPETSIILMDDQSNVNPQRVVQALQAGALDVITKPDNMENQTDVAVFRQQLLGAVRSTKIFQTLRPAHKLSGHKESRTDTIAGIEHAPSIPRYQHQKTFSENIDIVVMGVSTGGPQALTQVIPRLPRDLGVPILLVQHIPANFSKALANSLNKESSLTVKEAAAGDEILAGSVYIAPRGLHMLVEEKPAGNKHIQLSSAPPVSSCRPSVDVLFKSVADSGFHASLAVIMTGMGSDGLAGVRALKESDCYCISQSADTCVVYGMPRALDDAQLSDEQIPLEFIAERITMLVKNNQRNK